MKTKKIEIDGRKIIIGIDEGGNIVAEHYVPDSTHPDLKDRIELSAWLQGQGHKRGSKEYDTLYSEMSEGLPLNYKDGR